MRMQAVFARTFLFEGAEQAALGDVKRGGFDAARVHGGVAASVLLGVRNADLDAAGVDFDVLVAFNAIDHDFTGEHAHAQAGVRGDFDGGMEIVVRGIGDEDIGARRSGADLHVDLLELLGCGLAGDLNLVGVTSPNRVAARAEMKTNEAFGSEFLLDLGGALIGVCGVRDAGGQGQQQNGDELHDEWAPGSGYGRRGSNVPYVAELRSAGQTRASARREQRSSEYRELRRSDKRFDHLDEVEWGFHASWVRGVDASGGAVAATGVENLQLGAVIDEAQLHFVVTGFATVSFGGGHDLRSDAVMLVIGVDGDESDVRAGAAALDVDTGKQGAIVFPEQEISFEDEFPDAVGINALARDPWALRDEGAIDQARQGVGVFEVGGTDVERGHCYFYCSGERRVPSDYKLCVASESEREEYKFCGAALRRTAEGGCPHAVRGALDGRDARRSISLRR